MSEVAPGSAECEYGGIKVETGLDDGAGLGVRVDGILEDAEIETTTYVCNGAPGPEGQDGHSSLSNATDLPAGDVNCPFGGTRVDFGPDNGANGETADDGILGAGEVTTTAYVCNGADGTGAGGGDGQHGLTSLVDVTAEPAGDNCAAGGQRIDVGLDRDRDGILSSDEIDVTTYVCNAEKGADGQDGSRGADGGCSATGQNPPLSAALAALLLGTGVVVRRRRR